MIGLILLLLLGLAAAIGLLLTLGGDVLVFGLAVLLLAFAALALWSHHRRRIAEIHELDPREYRGFRRVNRMIAWPKYCLRCGMPANNRIQVRIHHSYDSACARLEAQDEEEANATEEPKELRVFDLRRVPKGGAHAIDTMFDDPAELEAGDNHKRT